MKNDSRQCGCLCTWPCISIGNIRLAINSLAGEDIRDIHLACLEYQAEGERSIFLRRRFAQNYFSHYEGEEAKTKT